MFVDNAPPITFGQLAHRFRKLGVTTESYRRRFRLPLSFEDILNPRLASEIVGYRNLIGLVSPRPKVPAEAKLIIWPIGESIRYEGLRVTLSPN
jgi:hypothetical protein